MTPPQEPLEITLDFTRPKGAFTWEAEDYHLRTKVDGKEEEGGTVRIPWDDTGFRQDLESLKETHPSTTTLERLGQRLRDCLVLTNWRSIVDRIESALNAQRPIHLTLRSNADQVYYLPWELLPLSAGNRFAGREDCLLQYECLPHSIQTRTRTPQGRILFAYSNAGGRVPAAAHHEALLKASQEAGFTFDPAEDVLQEASRTTLAEKLEETTDRPITVVHLLCHGSKVDDAAYGLALSPEEASSTPDVLAATELRDLLFSRARPHALRLVTLCACQSGDAGTPAHPEGSVARMFHNQNVPAAIASRLPLSSPGSVTLAETLYGELLREQGNLRTALFRVRRELRKSSTRDWISLQLYAREGDTAALYPFRDPPPPPAANAPKRELVLLCHEAYKKTSEEPEQSDAPALFAGRQPRREPPIDQTPALEQREWKNLESEVKRLTAPDGVLRRVFRERGTDVVYYGFPYVPLAVLAGYLAKNRPVHVLEYIANRFTWETDTSAPHLPLGADVQKREEGTAARVRISVSALVDLDDCRQVLPDADVRLDLHFFLEEQRRGSVRREDQLKAYVQKIRATLDEHILGNPSLESVHIFAAIPVSLAFHLGDALTATWLPACFVYNYGRLESPRYKWRLNLQAADKGRRSIKIFK